MSTSDEIKSPSSGLEEVRDLKIYTWGKARRKYKPQDSQKNFNACVISHPERPYNFNLKKITGRNKELQASFLKQSRFREAINSFANIIRKDPNLTIISINCIKGRHRSVAAAEVLKNILEYDGDFDVSVQHLEI